MRFCLLDDCTDNSRDYGRFLYPDEETDSALRLLWVDMKTFFRSVQKFCGCPKFSKKLICWDGPKDYPTLSSRVKGSNVKLVCRYLAWKVLLVLEYRGREVLEGSFSVSPVCALGIQLLDAFCELGAPKLPPSDT